MLINSAKFREKTVLKKFIHYLWEYEFIVTQDEDYLNLICKDQVFWLDQKWNTELTEGLEYAYDVTKADIAKAIAELDSYELEALRDKISDLVSLKKYNSKLTLEKEVA